MSDFEDRVSSALRSAGDDAPDATGLAPAARGRARARSRRTALATVAAVVIVGGVVVGATMLGDRDGGSTATPATDRATESGPSTPDAPVANTRVESWRDLSVTVPADWGHGNLDDWCGDGGDLGRPVVERPGASIDILCNPVNGYGVRFFDGSAIRLAYEPGHVWQFRDAGVNADYPVGSWLGYQRGSGDNLVWVVARDRSTVEQVLATFQANQSADVNGCTAEQGDDAAEPVAEGTLRLCRYDVEGWLEQSELLTGADAVKAVDALEGAPVRDPDQMCTMQLEGPTVLMTSKEAEGMLTLDACQGFTWDGDAHALTEDALYWALSPGWTGGVSGDVPMPSTLRR